MVIFHDLTPLLEMGGSFGTFGLLFPVAGSLPGAPAPRARRGGRRPRIASASATMSRCEFAARRCARSVTPRAAVTLASRSCAMRFRASTPAPCAASISATACKSDGSAASRSSRSTMDFETRSSPDRRVTSESSEGERVTFTRGFVVGIVVHLRMGVPLYPMVFRCATAVHHGVGGARSARYPRPWHPWTARQRPARICSQVGAAWWYWPA